MKIQKAILSVYHKTGLIEFAQVLLRHNIEIYSTGGTYKALSGSGIKALKIEDHAGSPEILSGRVKSLHFKVYGGILARRDRPQDMESLRQHEILAFDLVCINLYPFEEFILQTDKKKWAQPEFISRAMEMIDIGGPSMIRAAAKNHEFVSVLTDPTQYNDFITELKSGGGSISLEHRRNLASEAFNRTASYDNAIDTFFSQITNSEDRKARVNITLVKKTNLRYGENPHQKAAFFKTPFPGCELWEKLSGRELSYNNLLDIDTALSLLSDFKEPICAIFKHTNPCGLASRDSQLQNLEKAIESDPVSCFGGILLFNQKVEKTTSLKLNDIFFEIVIAPDFEKDSLEILKQKKNLRVIQYNPDFQEDRVYQIVSNSGGFLRQEKNRLLLEEPELKCVTRIKPDQNDLEELKFGWKLVKHVKSNAIVISNQKQSLGIGAGQMSRIDSLMIAVQKARKNGFLLKGSYLASDAFFPFKDVVEIASEAGIKAVIQPGGSIRDKESIDTADRSGISMLHTGIRHFKH